MEKYYVFSIAVERSVVGLGKIDPRSRSIVTYQREFSRCWKLRGHRPALLFFHPVSRGARARDYQTAGVRDCCTRQMLSRRSNLLSLAFLVFLSTVLALVSPSLPRRPATRCGASFPFFFALSLSPRRTTVLTGIHHGRNSRLPRAIPLDPLLPSRRHHRRRNVYTLDRRSSCVSFFPFLSLSGFPMQVSPPRRASLRA